MKIRKYCRCGVKLEREASDEEVARQLVEAFWTAHAGVEHGPIMRREYDAKIRALIKRASRPGLVESEMEAFEKSQIDDCIAFLEKTTQEP